MADASQCSSSGEARRQHMRAHDERRAWQGQEEGLGRGRRQHAEAHKASLPSLLPPSFFPHPAPAHMRSAGSVE